MLTSVYSTLLGYPCLPQSTGSCRTITLISILTTLGTLGTLETLGTLGTLAKKEPYIKNVAQEEAV